MVFHHDKCKAPKIFCFPSVRICYKQTYSAFYQSVHLQIPLSAYKESWKIHSTTPSVFSVFVYACVCVCLCLCARALYYVLLLFWYNSLIEGSLEPWMVGAIHAKDKYVNNCIVRYFEIFEVTKVLERLLNSLFDWWKGNTDCLPEVLLYYRPTICTVWGEISSASNTKWWSLWRKTYLKCSSEWQVVITAGRRSLWWIYRSWNYWRLIGCSQSS